VWLVLDVVEEIARSGDPKRNPASPAAAHRAG